MVVVVGYVAGVVVFDLAGDVGEGVPNRRTAPVFVDSSFNLIGGSRGSPEEALWEAACGWRSYMAIVGQGGEGGEHGGSKSG
jgi:hypothetical protein